jgi:hypothetical protein
MNILVAIGAVGTAITFAVRLLRRKSRCSDSKTPNLQVEQSDLKEGAQCEILDQAPISSETCCVAKPEGRTIADEEALHNTEADSGSSSDAAGTRRAEEPTDVSEEGSRIEEPDRAPEEAQRHNPHVGAQRRVGEGNARGQGEKQSSIARHEGPQPSIKGKPAGDAAETQRSIEETHLTPEQKLPEEANGEERGNEDARIEAKGATPAPAERRKRKSKARRRRKTRIAKHEVQEPQRNVKGKSDGHADSQDHVTAKPESERSAETSGTEGAVPPPQYRPPTGSPPAQPRSSSLADEKAARGDKPPTKNRAASIELRLLFERGGRCAVTLLPSRPNGLPEQCTVATENGSMDIVSVGDNWYQDVAPDELGTLLAEGFVWTDETAGQDWSLAGRAIFVLATGTTHRGFLSTSRLALGREHAVLCKESMLGAVEDALRNAGCSAWRRFGEDDGVPPGWIVLCGADNAGRIHGVVPRNSVPLADEADILNVLRPLPKTEISFEGGVRLGYNSWLAGYPPSIRIYGDRDRTPKVLIDGREADASPEGYYTLQGWDDPATHQVWCNGSSKTYSLVRLERNWKAWGAYSLRFRGSPSGNGRIAICGPLICPLKDPDSGETSDQNTIVRVLASNPVLVGAEPGQVFVAVPRHDIRSALCFASPSFAPVWALPQQALLCDKSVSRILLVGQAVGPSATVPLRCQHGNRARALELWCRLILDAGRKGLAVEPASASELWRQYKHHARNLWRKTR